MAYQRHPVLDVYGVCDVCPSIGSPRCALYPDRSHCACAQPALRLYLLAEHGDCPQVANMFANTRTTFTNRAMCWLAWNMPYHTEHHVWPSVPFSKLPILSKRLKDHLQVTSPGYIAFQRDFFVNAGRKEPLSGEMRSCVVFLHGYGANGADLLGLADPLAEHMPDTLFLAPDAPSVVPHSVDRWIVRRRKSRGPVACQRRLGCVLGRRDG